MPVSPENGVLAIETGAILLRCLAESGEPMQISALARASGVPAAKAHRYLQSFIRSGLVVQVASTRRYDLGPLAYSLGMAAILRHDALRAANERLAELRNATGESCALVIWTHQGPMVMRAEESHRHSVALVIRVGSAIPVLSSAAGHVLCAFLPETVTQRLVRREQARLPKAERDVKVAAFLRVMERTRRLGFSRIANDVLSGCSALAAPLFSHDGRVVAAIVVLGRSDVVDDGWDGRIGAQIRRFAAKVH